MSSVGSVYFNGGSVYSGANSSLILSGSFTIEFWFKSGNQSNPFNAAITQNAHIAGGVDIRITTKIQLLPNSGGSLYNGSRNNLNDNQWHNVAIVQNIGNNTLTVFIDGVQDGQNSNTSTWNYGTYGISLGQNPGYSSNWTGFLSNVRILNGTALYSSNYSVPTATYTAIPNTVFLFNANAPNNFEDSSPNNLTMLLRGTTLPVASIDSPNITLSTTQPILTELNNGVLSSTNTMPLKIFTSDNTQSFSINRQLFQNAYQPPVNYSLRQTTRSFFQRSTGALPHGYVVDGPKSVFQKKWIGGNRDASQTAMRRRMNSTGASMTATGPQSFKNPNDNNPRIEALARVRGGGAFVPPKVTKRLTVPYRNTTSI
jgi:hypothetical protein